MTRVFIADDHAVVRVGLAHLLTEVGGFEVVGQAENGRQVLNATELATCDVLVLDLSLPVVSGTEVLRRVRREHPDVAVVVHSMHPASQFRRRALEAGAVAYVPKDAPAKALVDAVRRAHDRPDEVQLPDDATPLPVPSDALSTLSRREHQVFLLIVEGRQVVDIAAELDLHACTVSNHLARIRSKLGVRTAADIVRFALAAGVLPAAPGFDAPGDGDPS